MVMDANLGASEGGKVFLSHAFAADNAAFHLFRHRATRSHMEVYLAGMRAFTDNQRRQLGPHPQHTSAYDSIRSCRLFARRANQSFGCPAPFAKIFRFTPDPNHFYISRHPVPHRGAFRAIVTDVGYGMRWTLQCQARANARWTNDAAANGRSHINRSCVESNTGAAKSPDAQMAGRFRSFRCLALFSPRV